MLFTGQADITIDAKQRLAIPSKFRGRLAEDAQDGAVWYCVPWPHEGVLRLYSEDDFERMADQGEQTLTPDQDRADLEATFYGLAERIEQDKAGRVRLPASLLELVEMPSEITVVGARNRLEIRDRAAWKAGMTNRFQQLRELVGRVDASSVRKNASAD